MSVQAALSAVENAIGSEVGDGPLAQALRALANLIDIALTTGGTIAKAVAGTNIANLSAASTTMDTVVLVQGDIVLLANQTTASQNGPYVVGKVTTGTAPLTRPSWWTTGQKFPSGFVIEVADGGANFGGTTWKSMNAGVVGTNDPTFYPKTFKADVQLVNGTVTIGQGGGGAADGLFLFSIADTKDGSRVSLSRNAAGAATALTVEYAAPAVTRVAGKPGTSVLVIQAEIAAGTINAADTLTSLDVVVTNW